MEKICWQIIVAAFMQSLQYVYEVQLQKTKVQLQKTIAL